MKMHWPILALAIVGIALTGCGRQYHYTASDLHAKPDARIVVPGTETLGENQQERGGSVMHPATSAFISYKYGSQFTASEVEDFYRQKLTQQGWIAYVGDDFLASTIKERSILWRKGDLGFQLTFLKKDAPASSPSASRFATYFEIVLIEVPNP
jgi:hypothetical protein